jgi:DNA recombination protein RmuC
VCFVPGEAILATALADDPGLYEHALTRKVVLASPGTLFAVLRTIGAIWQQDALEQNARELLAIGQDLYTRLTTLGGHVTTMGQSLSRSVEQYNKFVGTLESRVLVTARRMHELHLTSELPPTLEPLEVAARSLSASELTDDLGRSVRDDAFLERTAGDGTGRPDGATTSNDETVREQSA